MKRWVALAGFLAVTQLAVAQATVNHAELITGPFKTGPEVTKKCLECHEKQAGDFMKTPHWTWKEEQKADGKTVALGKANVINNFCIALPTNEPRCTSCHAGYGWKDASFDFSKAENVDCLVCHDTTGTYKKFPSAAGHPVYEGETKEFPPGKVWPAVDLLKVAQNVGKPSRATCGACHFYGGGGDHIKHGDLDSSMTNPPAELDIHMGKAGMTCITCHKTKDHAISGESLLISAGDGQRVACADCHKVDLHKNAVLNKHAQKVACQTCHIPTIARNLPTKVWWDWSKAGQDLPTATDAFGQKAYDKMKGEFRWNKDFAPTLLWYNGQVDRLLPGEKVDVAKQPVWQTRPLGDKSDAKALLTPFKIMAGKQPYDSENNYLVYVNLFGPQGYWKTYDWNQSIGNGMKAMQLPYSGKFGFIETRMAWKVNHMVVGKDKALGCSDCHGEKGRIDWKALGYKNDPKKK